MRIRIIPNGPPVHTTNKPAKFILTDLANFPFSDDIKHRADVIYNAMGSPTKRIKSRQMLLFFCVYSAHKELGISADPIKLGKYFGLTPGEVQKTNSMFSPLQTGYRVQDKFYSPLELVPDICRDIGISEETILDILASSKETLERNPQLYQSSPQTIAAGLVSYYITTRGIQIANRDDIVRATGRSIVTISSTRDRIALLDNSG